MFSLDLKVKVGGPTHLLHRSYAVPRVRFDIEVMWHITSHRFRVVVQSVLVRVVVVMVEVLPRDWKLLVTSCSRGICVM